MKVPETDTGEIRHEVDSRDKAIDTSKSAICDFKAEPRSMVEWESWREITLSRLSRLSRLITSLTSAGVQSSLAWNLI